MNKKIFGLIIIVVFLLFVAAPFTFREQIQSFLSLFSNDSEDQIGQQDEPLDLDLVDIDIPRVFDETLCVSFITPKDPNVVALKNEILQDSITLLTPDWIAIRDWVGNRIEYESDSEIHDEREYWQFSNETLYLKTGDCEDFSILLCSLLRANGWDSSSVHVIIGEQNNQHHAWVRLLYDGRQYNIEPQGNGFEIAIGDYLNLSGFEAIYFFNDLEFGAI
jgi:transglutaminase-like putative cysteine protease